MNSVTLIAHISDIHLRKSPSRNEEYEQAFESLYKSLSEKKPDRIVVTGDIVNEYLDLQSEQLVLAVSFLNKLASIAPLRIIRGNHDYRASLPGRMDSIDAILNVINNPNIKYYNSTDFFVDENITWATWHHGDKNNCPWQTKKGKQIESNKESDTQIYIDLFHESINGCKMPSGFDIKSASHNKISDFKGDYLFAGHIHKQQYLDKTKTKAYAGSLISQDAAEGDDSFHGYLLWDVINKTVDEISIATDYSYKSIKLTPFTDFEDLDYEIPNPTKHMKIRFVWCTLPQARTKDNERSLAQYYKSKYKNVSISHKNEFIEDEKFGTIENTTLSNISEPTIQQTVFTEYLEKIGTNKQLISDIIALDTEITINIQPDEITNIEWDLIKSGGKNFMSYEDFEIDWRDREGLFQIVGENEAGKTTILKSITYALFGKSLKTESRTKAADSKFVNNRNGADFCEVYHIIQANGDYYGIKRRTEIKRGNDGAISESPTKLDYYLLNSPDDALDENTSIKTSTTLNEDRRVKTQQKIVSIIGTYDNFMRIVVTTAATLDKILSNDMAVFIDSLLFDSGLDIFDKKLEGLKTYLKTLNERGRIVCDVLKTEENNAHLKNEIDVIDVEIENIETTLLPELQTKIKTGQQYIETLLGKLFKIDPEISALNVNTTQLKIFEHNTNITNYNTRKEVILSNISLLKETYDAKRLNELNIKKDEHKTKEYGKRLEIKSIEQNIRNEEHSIEIINGDVFKLKNSGIKCRADIAELKNSKICPTCNQILLPEHQEHIDNKIKAIEVEMREIGNQIKTKENVDKLQHTNNITKLKEEVVSVQNGIESSSFEMELTLKEIGELTNDKNDVEKRNQFQSELEKLPIMIQNEELKISVLNNKIDNYNNSIIQIEENKKTEKGIEASRTKLNILNAEEKKHQENIFINKSLITEKSNKIKANNTLITSFKEQEYRDSVINLYKKCVHRDGIPRQILSTHIIPKINKSLQTILSSARFKIWLDEDDLRPKLSYYERPNAIIDCIGSCGKETVFSSVALKFALNQINAKSKPLMLLLDETMGMLTEKSIDEFLEMLQCFKETTKRILIIEHRANIEPDYLINVSVNENGISSLRME